MDTLELLGYAGAIAIGLVLGLIGGGGSILTVPIFVYLMGISPVTATAYSLFVVGVSALVGAIRNAQKGMIDFRTGIVFALPALTAVYATRKFILPALPEHLFDLGGVTVTKDLGVMVLFAAIMLLASISMIRGRKEKEEKPEKKRFNYPLIVVEGLVVGLLTGLVGAGGGFLIIPALVLLAGLPMKKAVATSLLIIALKSLIGFLGDLGGSPIDWSFLLTFSALSTAGIFLGLHLNKYIDGNQLKKGFGWFVLVMGGYILLRETLFL